MDDTEAEGVRFSRWMDEVGLYEWLLATLRFVENVRSNWRREPPSAAKACVELGFNGSAEAGPFPSRCERAGVLATLRGQNAGAPSGPSLRSLTFCFFLENGINVSDLGFGVVE